MQSVQSNFSLLLQPESNGSPGPGPIEYGLVEESISDELVPTTMPLVSDMPCNLLCLIY